MVVQSPGLADGTSFGTGGPSTEGRFRGWWPIPPLLLASLLLTAAAAGGGILPGDLATTRAIQRAGGPVADALALGANWAGAGVHLTLLTAGLGLVLVFARRYASAALVAATLGARAANPLLKAIAASPRPAADLVRVSEHAPGPGFPSGHAMGALLLYGAIFYLAREHVGHRRLRLFVQVVAVTMIGLTGLARVYVGAHWPSDVIGGYLWGTTLLLALLLGREARRVATARQRVAPRPAAGSARGWRCSTAGSGTLARRVDPRRWAAPRSPRHTEIIEQCRLPISPTKRCLGKLGMTGWPGTGLRRWGRRLSGVHRRA